MKDILMEMSNSQEINSRVDEGENQIKSMIWKVSRQKRTNQNNKKNLKTKQNKTKNPPKQQMMIV